MTCERCGSAFGPFEKVAVLRNGQLVFEWRLCGRCRAGVLDAFSKLGLGL